MALNFKIVLLAGVLGINTAQAYDDSMTEEMNEQYLTITGVQVNRITKDVLNQETSAPVETGEFDKGVRQLPGLPHLGKVKSVDPGQVLAIAQGVVALGESVYSLVQKGKPSARTTYAPISVVPRTGNEVVDIFDTEDWKAPKKYTYEIVYVNGFNMDVIKFRYSVIYSWGGTYNGKGAYLTAVQIIPISVNVLFGFDFTATMKLGGVMNHGKKDNPLAGAVLNLEYTISTVLEASVDTRNYHVMGNGAFRKI